MSQYYLSLHAMVVLSGCVKLGMGWLLDTWGEGVRGHICIGRRSLAPNQLCWRERNGAGGYGGQLRVQAERFSWHAGTTAGARVRAKTWERCARRLTKQLSNLHVDVSNRFMLPQITARGLKNNKKAITIVWLWLARKEIWSNRIVFLLFISFKLFILVEI
jgi:hypothetical protein